MKNQATKENAQESDEESSGLSEASHLHCPVPGERRKRLEPQDAVDGRSSGQATPALALNSQLAWGILLGLSTYRDSHGGPLTLVTVEGVTVRQSVFKADECLWRAGTASVAVGTGAGGSQSPCWDCRLPVLLGPIPRKQCVRAPSTRISSLLRSLGELGRARRNLWNAE